MIFNKIFAKHPVFLTLFVVYFTTIGANVLHTTSVTTTATPTSTLQRSISSDGLTNHNIKAADQTAASNTLSAAIKSYDPPPEFYRGPGSTGHYTTTVTPPSSYYGGNYKPSNEFISHSKPIAFPDTYNGNKHDNHNNKYNAAAAAGGGGIPDNSDDVHLANSYNTWQHLKDKVSGLLHKKGTLQDRISVGHYGTSAHGIGSGGSSSSSGITGSDGYTYESRPYGGQAPTHHVEYIPVHANYGGSSPPTAHASGYYGSSSVAEGIPFDVYGNKNHHYSGAAEAGGHDYASYSYTDVHEPAVHKTHPDISQKALLAKSFLIPLASAAVLGIAAALVSNPLLLQLGTVSGIAPGATIIGKRKRRALTSTRTFSNLSPPPPSNNLNLSLHTKKKDTSLLPYRAHHRQHHHYNRH
ncbi:hypothetical protein DOY81_002066 [Sarcophaga bullata]|nr:hypothetical protein DOY81_002066 [Sarcophaga bullata]